MEHGDYVLATKYSDGDPCDQWAVGFYSGPTPSDRHMVVDADGNQFRPGGFRRCEPITGDMGAWLLRVVPPMEMGCPPGVNIWGLIEGCREFNDDAIPPNATPGNEDHLNACPDCGAVHCDGSCPPNA